MGTTRIPSLARVAVSGVVVFVLLLQGLAAFRITFGPIEPAPFLYPFLDYPMYGAAHTPGAVVTQHRVYGVRADSSVLPLAPADLGLGFWFYEHGLVKAVRDADTARLITYERMYRSRQGEPLVGFRLKNHPIEITSAGLRPGEAELLRSVPLQSSP